MSQWAGQFLAAGDPWYGILIVVIWVVLGLLSQLSKLQKPKGRPGMPQAPAPLPPEAYQPAPTGTTRRPRVQQGGVVSRRRMVAPKIRVMPVKKAVPPALPKPQMVARPAGIPTGEDDSYALSRASQARAEKVSMAAGAKQAGGGGNAATRTITPGEIRRTLRPHIARRQMALMEILMPPVALRNEAT